MGFVIKKIVVHSEPTRVRGGEAHYNMVREKWDVRNLLEVSFFFTVSSSNFIHFFHSRLHFGIRYFHENIVIKIFVSHIYSQI